MKTKKCQNKLHIMIGIFKRVADTNMSMRIRLFAFLVALVATMVLGVVILSLLTGPLTADRGEAERFVNKEFAAIRNNLTVQCGNISVQLVLLSESLSKSIENRLLDGNIRVSDLQAHPEVLEDVVGNELSRLQLALEKTNCSGVFLVLDATVNSTLENAEHSRAGLGIRNAEPELPGPDMTKRYVRGFPGIAYQNGLPMLANWDMEFDVKDRAFYHLPLEKYNESKLPLSRLYYWSFESVLANCGEAMLLCSIPLIDSNGKAFGVCGFEISATKFQANYTPDDSLYRHVFGMFSTLDDNSLDPQNALFSGNHTRFSAKQNKLPLNITDGGNGLHTYAPENGKALLGLHEEIKLYPADAAFADRRFAAALLIPAEELEAATFRMNMRLILICTALMILGVCVSLFISKKYLNPIMSAFNAIRSDNIDKIDDIAKTNIVEIDRLIEEIKALRTKENPLPDTDHLFEDFIEQVKTLTPTEMAIFQHYLEGKSANEILPLLFISANTLKVHNKHIYTKLGVSSKDELMLYIELIKRSGMLEKIT